MPLQKQPVSVNFSQGLNTKSDPWQLPVGQFLILENSIFGKQGLLQKRNGFASLTTLPKDNGVTTLNTFNNNLIALGSSLFAYSGQTNQWEDQGPILQCATNIQPLVRNNYSQAVCDTATSPNGLACTSFLDGDGVYKYTISEYATGQALINSVALPSGATLPRVFLVGSKFLIVFLRTITATVHLQYIAIPLVNIANPGPAVNVSSLVTNATAGWDGAVNGDNLYLAWSSTGGNIRMTYIDIHLNQHNTITIAGHQAALMSMTVDSSANTPIIWVTAYDSGDAYSFAVNQTLIVALAPIHSITATTVTALTSVATAQVLTLFYEVQNTYTYSSVRTDFIDTKTVTQAGVVGIPTIMLRSVGLASKAFFVGTSIYMLVAYAGTYQPTYFLINSIGQIIAKIAYSNGAGYASSEILPSATVTGSMVQIAYLLKDLIQAVNKDQNPTSVNGVYNQTGINLATFNLASGSLITSEIAQSLNVSGGIVWMYDGVKPVELNFNVWPEDAQVTTSTSGGSLSAQTYFYQITYEWTDGQGLVHRSAPSIPYTAVTTGASSSNTLNIPTLRLTYKTTPNGVRIVIYRWSTGQQNYYQITSITSPLLNDPSVDSVVYVDTQSDSAIIGNALIYTTGGVVEDIAPPGTSTMTLFDTRLFLVDDEDPNLLWFSKQAIEATPVETSDLFTKYISPTSGAQGSTGPITALAPLDDKLIVFKKNALVYFNGTGPDITGANNQYSEPVFITSTVGCSNMNSIAFIPNGLMFQSDKGIWLLGRDLNTSYIGAPVEAFNNAVVVSAVTVPGTNQVRFALDNGVILMYDYYYNQWGTFVGVPAISSTLYLGMHTLLNKYGSVLQESPGLYLDESNPVLMSFTTSWINLAGLQGYERFYFMYILGKYITPFKLQVLIGYDYDFDPKQSIIISPTNFNGSYGSDALYGDNLQWGGNSNVFEERVFPMKQKCEAFQIQMKEIYDPSLGVVAGAGLTLSGLNLVTGLKKGYRTNKNAQNWG